MPYGLWTYVFSGYYTVAIANASLRFQQGKARQGDLLAACTIVVLPAASNSSQKQHRNQSQKKFVVNARRQTVSTPDKSFLCIVLYVPYCALLRVAMTTN